MTVEEILRTDHSRASSQSISFAVKEALVWSKKKPVRSRNIYRIGHRCSFRENTWKLNACIYWLYIMVSYVRRRWLSLWEISVCRSKYLLNYKRNRFCIANYQRWITLIKLCSQRLILNLARNVNFANFKFCVRLFYLTAAEAEWLNVNFKHLIIASSLNQW